MAEHGVMEAGEIAARGGFYPTGERDGQRIQMRCRESCRGEIWVTEGMNTEDLWNLHAREYNGCLLVQEHKGCDYVIRARQDFDVINIKTLRHVGDVTALLFHQSPQLQNLGHPNHPLYSLYVQRKQTYERFPRNIAHGLDDMLCGGGFFHVNRADTVECFWCGVQLTNFSNLIQSAHTFDLWRIHARQSPCCALVALVKGPRYVHRVFDEMTEEQKRLAGQMIEERKYNYASGMRDELFGQRLEVEMPEGEGINNVVVPLQLPAEQLVEVDRGVPQEEHVNNVAHTQYAVGHGAGIELAAPRLEPMNNVVLLQFANHDATPFLDHNYMAEVELAQRRRNEDVGRNFDVAHQNNDEYRTATVQPAENNDYRVWE